MKSMKVVAFLAFLLNTILFATYYAVAKEALERIDPIMFTFFEIVALAPAGLCIVALTWKAVRWPIIKQGFLLGSSLGLALFTIAIALKYTTATGTAFFPALNGFLAALIAWVFLRQPVTKATWCAGLLSTIGVTLLIMNSPMGGIRGVLIAFLGGLFFTGYVFLSDNHTHSPASSRPPSPNAEITLFGIELLTMALWACLIALLFGDWEAIHMSLPKDGLVILYVATACTFLPTLLTVLLQKHTSPVTVSFIYILEPVFSAIIAMLYLHEMLPLYGYLGGILVVAGAIIHTSGTLWQQRVQFRFSQTSMATATARGDRHYHTRSAATTRMAAVPAETKLLGLRFTSRSSMPPMPTVSALPIGTSGTFSTTEPLPPTIRTIPDRSHQHGIAAAYNRRSTYSIGAIEWVDDDICERPTRPVLDTHTSRVTRDLSVWLDAHITNQPTEALPTVPKSRVRTTEDLREISLPMRPPSPMRATPHTPVGAAFMTPTAPTHSHAPTQQAAFMTPPHTPMPPKTGGKGPVWLEEDARNANIFEYEATLTGNYQAQPLELAESLD